MLKCLIALTSLISTAALAVPVWTWVDDAGRRHYSDRPVEGAVQVEIGVQQPSSNRSVQPPASQQQQPVVPAQPAFSYEVFEIVSPEPEQTFNNIGGQLPVEVITFPALRASDRIDLILDGEYYPLGSRQLTMTVPDVVRGEHTLQMVIVDSSGNELKTSIPVTFFVRQNSVQTPPPPGAAPRPSLVPSGAAGARGN